jgi:hypothetical protein
MLSSIPIGQNQHMKKVISLLAHCLSQALRRLNCDILKNLTVIVGFNTCTFRVLFKNSKRVVLIALITFFCSNNLLAGYTINAGVTADPASIPALLNATGTINIYGIMSINSNVTFTSSTPLTIFIYGNNGEIIWNANSTLALPAGSTIKYINNPSSPPGLVYGGPQSASKILQIGAVKYAAANDNSNNVVFSFAQINSIGGTATIHATTATPSVCYGSPGSLSANEILPGGTPYYIQWASTGGTFSDNNTTTASSATVNGIPAGNDTILCSLFANAGGSNYYPVSTDTIFLAVKQTPVTPTSSLTAPPSCTKATGTITVSAPTGTGLTYSSDGATYSNTNGIFAGLAAGSYNLTAKNSIGCISPVTSVTVNVQPPTPAAPTASVTSQPTCAVATATITITAPTGNGINYSTDGVTYANTTGVFSGMSAGSYNLTVKNSSTCISSPTSVTINAQPATPTVSAANNGPVCAGAPVSLTATSVSGATYSWTGPNSFNSTLQNPSVIYSAAYAGTFTVTVTSSAGCSAGANTNVVSNGVAGLWTGNISANWANADNWCNDILPTISTNVTIPSSVTNLPVVVDNEYCKDLLINTGATLNVTGTGILQIWGNVTNNGTFNAVSGTIEMKSSSAQSIPANTFVNNALNNLIISNSSATGVTLNGALNIYGSLTFTGAGRIFTTNDYLTIKSTAAATAWVGDLTGNTITGKVTVERYIAAHKAWHFLAVPTNTTQTIKQTWQEGAVNLGSNPVPGFGTEITSNRSTWASDGFDTSSLNPSVKKYNAVTNAWVGVANTNVLDIKATDGYCIFVRGDRLATGLSSPATQTVLRTTGNLYVGDQPAIAVPANQFMAIGNPYASAIDMRNITKTGLKDFFYVWDPQLAGFYGYGGYQTFSSDGSGNYVVTPGSGSFGTSGSVSNYIKSGLAFFVQATAAGGSITFKEAAKGNSAGQANTPASLPWPQLRANVYGISPDKTVYMADGLLINYGDNFSNGVDSMDALKSYNTSENLSVKTGGTLLVVERRHTIVKSDTVFLNLTGVKAQGYRFEFMATGVYQPGLNGFLEDTYLKTRTPLNIDGTTTADFSIVNIAGSRAANRFRIVFTPQAILPVTFTSLKAYPVASKIAVEWTVDNETNINQYVVEKSLDGTSFNKLATTPATANGGHSASYQVTDSIPADGYNYYRVKSVDISGQELYTGVVKVLIAQSDPAISVYPNPVVNGIINLHLTNQPAGIYNARLTDNLGQLILEKEINHPGGNTNQQWQLPKDAPRGVYHLEIINSRIGTHTIKIVY